MTLLIMVMYTCERIQEVHIHIIRFREVGIRMIMEPTEIELSPLSKTF